jgi:hypothetical protein
LTTWLISLFITTYVIHNQLENHNLGLRKGLDYIDNVMEFILPEKREIEYKKIEKLLEKPVTMIEKMELDVAVPEPARNRDSVDLMTSGVTTTTWSAGRSVDLMCPFVQKIMQI